MALDDTRAAFAEAAAADGIELQDQSFDWLCEQGHVGLERVAKARRDPALVAPVTAALDVLATIYARLKGDVSVLHASRENLLLPGDSRARAQRDGGRGRRPRALHVARACSRSISTPPARRSASTSRPSGSSAAPGARPPTALSRGLPAKGFGFGGVQRERAYHDALRDLATPAMGHPPLIRIAAVDGDGATAYARRRDSLASLRRSAAPGRADPTRP